MQPTDESRSRIPADLVRHTGAPVLVTARPTHGHGHEIAVQPILDDGRRVAGFEVRCGCGSHVYVECVDALPSAATHELQRDEP